MISNKLVVLASVSYASGQWEPNNFITKALGTRRLYAVPFYMQNKANYRKHTNFHSHNISWVFEGINFRG